MNPLALCLALALATAAPTGETVNLPVTRDTWFSNVGSEAEANLGGAAKLKLKSYQEMSLIDIDPTPLRGRVVLGATLHLKAASDPPLRRVTVGTFGADWVEGTATSYAPQAGGSSFNHRRNPDVPWTVPGGDLCGVILGQGGTIWRMADAEPPDAKGWQRIAVEPRVVAARTAGISSGFFLFDDTGSEWTRQGERFTFHHFPNRFVQSRDSNRASAPYLTVVLGAEDRDPPGAPSDVKAEAGDLPSGEAWISWLTPKDAGASGTIGFVVERDGTPLPRYLIPPAGAPGGRVRMHLRDLGLAPGATVALAIRAVDGAGNIGPAARATVRVSDRTAPPLPGRAPIPIAEPGPPPRLAGAEVAVLDELDKVNLDTGALIPEQPEGYRAANHLWSARTREVRLHAARNEFVGFQVALKGSPPGVTPALTFEAGPGASPGVEFGRYYPIPTGRGPLADPIAPLALPTPSNPYMSLHCEVYVPHGAKAGIHRGTLTLKSGGESLVLPVSLTVWDFTLPDFLSFLPEMNCYGLPDGERDYYRLAHRHRTVLNRVPYHQNGSMEPGCAPGWDGKTLDWSAYDRRFGPYLDGSAFADLPRRGVPIECFYLPLFENWPTPIEGHYNGDYWADRAFPASYRTAFVAASRQVAAHAREKGWNETLLQCFFNGKVDFKRNGWSRGSSPWLLDEPASFQDFWALRYFGAAFHEGINQAPGPARLVFRADVSRPQWQRDALDGLLDYLVVGGAMRPYHRIVFDRKEATGQVVVEYGGSNPIEEPNVQPVGWCLDAWSLGADGVLPWQTVGTPESWKHADVLSLFYPGLTRGAGPVPSIRLKAYRRGQQDVEYLVLLARQLGLPRRAVGERVREQLRLTAERRGAGEEAGLQHYARLRPRDDWALRVQLGEALDALHPPAERRLIDLRTPRRDPAALAPGYVPGAEGP